MAPDERRTVFEHENWPQELSVIVHMYCVALYGYVGWTHQGTTSGMRAGYTLYRLYYAETPYLHQ